MTRSKKVVIVDYHLGNLFSVNQALSSIGLSVSISSDPREVEDADAIVLPGVGAFADAMSSLNDLDLIEPIKNFVNKGKPFMGVCLGLQLLFTESEEFGHCNGLNLIEGNVRRFEARAEGVDGVLKVPQIGWNQIYPANAKWENSPLAVVKPGEYVYFVHSYYVVPSNDESLSETSYGAHTYTSSILKNNIFACQFHPEKSGPVGLKIYTHWAELNNLI